MPACNLCQIVHGAHSAQGRVYEDEWVVVLLDTAHAGTAQLLVIPKRHGDSLASLDEDARARLLKLSKRAGSSLQAAGLGTDVPLAVLTEEGDSSGHAHLRVCPAPA